MLNPTKKSCQNLLRVWHSVIIRVDLSKKTPCVFLRSFDDVNIVAGRTTGTMEVTQSVQRWVMNSNWQESMCSFRWPKVSWSTPRARATTSPPQEEDSQASNLEICGVYVQRAGGRLVHVMSDLVSWLRFNLCPDFFFSEKSFSLSLQAMLAGSAPRVVAAATHQASLQVEKSWCQNFKSTILSGQLGRGDDSTGWLLSWICLKSRRLYLKIPNKLWIFIQSICLSN